MHVVLDGKRLEAEREQTVLELARARSVFIPSLCFHEGLGPYGACRLCLVEVVQGGPPGIHSSCTLPVSDGLEVVTTSERVRRARRIAAELLLARAPDVAAVREIAARCGVEVPRFAPRDETCILCGRCVRACGRLGIYAIDFAWRGLHRRVVAPFDKTSATCIACRACFNVCPTGAIESALSQDSVRITPPRGKPLELERIRCTRCGTPYISQKAWDYMHQKQPEGLKPDESLCPACRRNRQLSQLTRACP